MFFAGAKKKDSTKRTSLFTSSEIERTLVKLKLYQMVSGSSYLGIIRVDCGPFWPIPSSKSTEWSFIWGLKPSPWINEQRGQFRLGLNEPITHALVNPFRCSYRDNKYSPVIVGNALPENMASLSLILNWVGLMQELLENHLEEKQNALWLTMPKCFYRFTRGEKLERINLHYNWTTNASLLE